MIIQFCYNLVCMAVFPIEVAGAKSTIGTYKKVSVDRKQTNRYLLAKDLLYQKDPTNQT